jgi:hypothetical protein
MAIPWLTVLKSVPWTDVIVNAPKVAEGAKKLWNSVGKKAAATQEAAAPAPDSAPEAVESVAQLQARLAALETVAAELHEQMLASSEVIKSLAEQNAQLIRGIEANRIRLRWLAVAVVSLCIAAAATAVWSLSR